MAAINVDGVNEEYKRKTIFVLKAKGSTLSEEVRKMTERYAREFDRMNQTKNEQEK